MNLKEFQKKSLSKKELQLVVAGVAPDCEPNVIRHIAGTEWVCDPECKWVLT